MWRRFVVVVVVIIILVIVVALRAAGGRSFLRGIRYVESCRAVGGTGQS